MAEAGIEPPVGSRGDSYDDALAETINGMSKTELIHRRAHGQRGNPSNWLLWNGLVLPSLTAGATQLYSAGRG